MALSAFPVVFANAASASTAAVAPTVVIPDNCHTVVLYNPTLVDAFVGRASVGTPLVEGTNSTRLPSKSSLTLAIGTLAQRGVMDEALLAGSGLVYSSSGLVATSVDITYVCSLGE
jgi:hypothetical protein